MTLYFVLGLLALMVLFHFWFEWSEERRAHKFVRDCNGDLPPPEALKDKGHSLIFLATLTGYYVEAARQREKRDKLKADLGARVTEKLLGETINPLPESDCPECSNGVVHENCRSGWRAVLYAAALGDLDKLPKWTSPCDTCGGNCGQCGSSHCGICGVKPRDGVCDLRKHAAYERTHPEARRPL